MMLSSSTSSSLPTTSLATFVCFFLITVLFVSATTTATTTHDTSATAAAAAATNQDAPSNTATAETPEAAATTTVDRHLAPREHQTREDYAAVAERWSVSHPNPTISSAFFTKDAAFDTTTSSGGNTAAAAADLRDTVRIVGGDQSDMLQFPYFVLMGDAPSGGCGGSLIAPRVVLTAAHCQPSKTNLGNNILVGAYNRFTASGNTAKKIRVAKVVDHPQYDENAFNYDYALVLLAEPYVLEDIQQYAQINDNSNFPPTPYSAYLNGRAQLVTMGLGTLYTDGPLAKIVRDVTVPYITNAECQRVYTNTITSKMLCAGWIYTGEGSCVGDSGGPLVSIDSNNIHTQVGIVSFGIEPCGIGPGVYARVSAEIEWMKQTMCTDWKVEASLCGNLNPNPSPTPVPRPPPTRAPSRTPTRRPTAPPQPQPTPVPRVPPTQAPSQKPTRAPSRKPTTHPTVPPQPQPTPVPQVPPTQAPSRKPTRVPSQKPTTRPTVPPQPQPTPVPQVPPTRAPSRKPTRAPSRKPTPFPTVSPSSSPVNNQQQQFACDNDTNAIGRFRFSLTMDSYAVDYQETSWELLQNDNQQVIVSIPKEKHNEKRTYEYPQDDTSTEFHTVKDNNNQEFYCLQTNTCYTVTLQDANNDGLNSGEGKYKGLLDNTIVFEGDGDFGAEISHEFCVGDRRNEKKKCPPNTKKVIYILPSNGKSQKCGWIKKGKTLEKRRKRCDEMRSPNNEKKIKHNCPKACGKYAGVGKCKDRWLSSYKE